MVDFPPSSIDAVADEDRDPRVVGVDSDDADDLVAALSSQTGRDILAALYEEPATPAAIAERVDTSLQNAQYHLGKLADGNLVEVADTMYSSKGREMKVYAPVAEPLVLFAGNESDTAGLKSALKNLLGGLGVLGLASLVVQRLSSGGMTLTSGDSNDGGKSSNGAGGGDVAQGTTSDSAGGDAIGATQSPTGSGTTESAARKTAETTTTVADRTTAAVGDATTTVTRTVAEGTAGVDLPPGLLFFAGGALVLALAFAVWYVRARREREP
ncbi:ArsR/SmtB family transcription factor [Haladaptatus salinisoli]|uniref:ArsR/SmtB family transcription factor n=1 Tax=Haladaptatus salinisoli TaxID=2884876 RepID=UPI001D0AF307|nr:winged helix-turn-helix domain-containing protein [Haladaptatus salinisoli]